MTTKHTPGPWYTKAKAIDPHDLNVLHDDKWGSVYVTSVRIVNTTPTATEANARLITAAPDLLAALQEMIIANHGIPANPEDESDHVRRSALIQARAAIQAATGEAL